MGDTVALANLHAAGTAARSGAPLSRAEMVLLETIDTAAGIGHSSGLPIEVTMPCSWSSDRLKARQNSYKTGVSTRIDALGLLGEEEVECYNSEGGEETEWNSAGVGPTAALGLLLRFLLGLRPGGVARQSGWEDPVHEDGPARPAWTVAVYVATLLTAAAATMPLDKAAAWRQVCLLDYTLMLHVMLNFHNFVTI